LAQLNVLYDRWVDSFTLSPVLTIETDNLNYVRYEDHLDRIWESIDRRLRGKDYLAL
jgi:deoxyadenosine/deoxycytidine kinase